MNSVIPLLRTPSTSTISIATPFNRRFVAIALACCIAASADAGTPGLANGNFDLDLSGWDLSGTPPPTWSMLDVTGNPGSGSVMLLNADMQTMARVYPLRQCIAFYAPGTYVVEADGFLPAGHPGGRLVVSYATHTMPGCTGGTQSLGGYFLQSNGSWVHGSANIVIGAGIQSLDVSLGIEKDLGGGLLSGNIDAVHAFNRDPIFSSGFEGPDLPSPPM